MVANLRLPSEAQRRKLQLRLARNGIYDVDLSKYFIRLHVYIFMVAGADPFALLHSNRFLNLQGK